LRGLVEMGECPECGRTYLIEQGALRLQAKLPVADSAGDLRSRRAPDARAFAAGGAD